MRKQAYPVANLTKGLNVNVDPSFILDNENPNIRNFRFHKGMLRKDLGKELFGSNLPLDGVVMYIDTFWKYDGSSFLLVCTTKNIYLYSTTTSEFSIVTPTGVELTGTEDDSFDSVTTFTSTGDDIYYLTNGVDPIMSWQGTGLFIFRTDYCKRLASFQSRLIQGFTIESGNNCPTRVRWSVVGDPEDMSGVGSGFVDLVTTVDWISALRPYKDKLFINKETSIWELVYVGGTTYFLPIIRIDGIGTYAPNSVCSLGEEIVFLANDNVYTYDGISLKAIGDQISTLLFDTAERIMNAAALHRCTAIFIEEAAEYWVTIPTEGERTSVLLKYNFTTKSWSRKDVAYTALGYYIEATSLIWNSLVGTWAEQDWIWMERKLPAGTPTTLIGDADGNLYEDARLSYDTDYATFDTKDWFFSYAQRWVEFRIVAKGTGAVKVSYSIDAGSSWSVPRTFTPNNQSFDIYTLPINITSDKIRCRIETNATDLIIKWIEPWYIARVRAKEVTMMG